MSKPIHFKTYVYQELDGSPGGVCVPHETYLELAAEKDDVFDKLKHCADMGAKLADEVIELRTANAELVEALKGIELEIAHDHVDGSIQIIIEALAKHGGNAK